MAEQTYLQNICGQSFSYNLMLNWEEKNPSNSGAFKDINFFGNWMKEKSLIISDGYINNI